MPIDLDDCKVGQRATMEVEVDDDLITAFASFSGDRNPLHLDSAFAEGTRFKRRVAHGMSYAALFSRLIGMDLPGAGALWLSQSYRFGKPAFIGDRLTLSVAVTAVNASTRTLDLDCRAVNQLGEEILTGSGEVMLLEEVSPVAKPATPKTRVAIVTGGSRGIGAAIARRLAADGFAVAFTYHNARDEAEALCAELDNAICLRSDAADPDAMRRLYEQVAERFGSPDTLVLNAGARDLYAPAADGDFKRFRRHLDGQLAGPHALVSVCLGGMIAGGSGAIIAVGSTYAHGAPPPGMAPYVVAKAALGAYIRCLACEYGNQGVRANLVAPAMTETALLSAMADRNRKVAARQNPLRRLGAPDDIAGAVAFLASSDAAYVNGHTLVVSGGSLMP
jgi:3-oxoacyl-[acyl-carrier protein] reductase